MSREGRATDTITVSSTARGLTPSKYDPGDRDPYSEAIITVEDDEIRFWTDGSVPTVTEGHLAGVGDVIHLDSHNEIKFFKAIRVTGDAVLQITYEDNEPYAG